MKKTIVTFLSFLSFVCAENQEYFFFSPNMIFSYIKNYSEEEREAILKDLEVVRNVCAPSHKKSSNKKPLYLATAGAPGTKKTTILERFMRRYILNAHVSYLDPDQRALKYMQRTYYGKSLDFSENENYSQTIKNAYEKWRDASNYITYTLLEDAFINRQNIAHGTTSTDKNTPRFLSKVKQAGYEIILLLCSAEEPLRKKAIEYRNNEQKFYQLTPEDAISKKKLSPIRMQAYFNYADSLHLFWSDTLFKKERLAATFSNGQLQVYDQSSFNQFISQFEKDRNLILEEGMDIPSWNELLEIYRKRF